MAGITTHILDTERGRPIPGIRIDFSVKNGDVWTQLRTLTTNADGRTDGPVVLPADAKIGEYQLEFHVADYLAQRGGGAAFVDNAVVRFSVSDVASHYHVPPAVHAGKLRDLSRQLSRRPRFPTGNKCGE